MKKAVIFVLVLGLLGAGGYGAYHYFYENREADSERVSSTSEDAVYVDLVSRITGYGSGNGLIERYGGEVKPQATLEIKLESERKVKECYVKEGDEVKEGQRLFTYDTQEDEDNLAQAEIELERLEGEIEVSEKQIAQYEKDKKNASSEDQIAITTSIMELQTSIKKSEYEIKTKKLEMERKRESIANATVNAEMAGIIQSINDPDQWSSYSYSYGSESSAYITILQAGDYRVKGTVNEQAINLGQIYQGMPVVVHSRVDADKKWYGTVSEVNTDDKEENQNTMYYSSSSNGSSSNYAFYVELESCEDMILGQHVYIEQDIGQDEEKDGLWLEEYYLILEGDQAYVWLANTSNVIEKHEVTLGEYDEETMKYEITDGLDAEDYIAYPMDTVAEGAPVIYNDFSSATPDMMGGEDMMYDNGSVGGEDMMYDDGFAEDEEMIDGAGYMDDGGMIDGAGYMDDGGMMDGMGYSDDGGTIEDMEDFYDAGNDVPEEGLVED